MSEGDEFVFVDVVSRFGALDLDSWAVGRVSVDVLGAPALIEESTIAQYTASLRARLYRPAVNSCTADFDGDGDVDLGDFGVFGAAFGSAVGDANYDAAADFDGDGDVDLGDFGVFGGQFGRADCLA